ncbi:MAG: N-acetylmuramoyl-L-alanine amidase [Acidobacteriota bacterium]
MAGTEDTDFPVDDSWRIPVEPGQAVDRGWTAATGHRPLGVTWHWTATRTLERCHQLLGGARAERRGQASAHFAVGRHADEGVARYVSLDDRSWHAGRAQTLRFDGQPYRGPDDKGARTAVGVETVHIGYARDGVEPGTDWLNADTVDGETRLRIAPWPDPQIDLMIGVGREIQSRWPHLGPRHHHGHHDLCPGYKVDVLGFPFARVLRGIYRDPEIPDVWSDTWTAAGRRRALRRLGFATGGGLELNFWTRADDLTLRRAQRQLGLEPNGLWTTAVAWAVDDAIQGRTTPESPFEATRRRGDMESPA